MLAGLLWALAGGTLVLYTLYLLRKILRGLMTSGTAFSQIIWMLL